MTEQTKTNRIATKLKNSTSVRMLIIGFLILVLMIPLAFIKDLIRERKYRQSDTVQEINKKWGEEIILYGPIVKLPYTTYSETLVKDDKTGKTQTITEKFTKCVYFFPNELDISGDIKTIKKHLGMYTTPVYNTKLNIKGSFTPLDIGHFEIMSKDVQWDKAKILMKTTNIKGINNEIMINFGDKSLLFESNFENYTQNDNIKHLQTHTLETKGFNAKELFAEKISFDMIFEASGSEKLQIIPIGKETNLKLTSDWKSPNFTGEYSPYNEDAITDNGFNAKWKVLQMNRPFSQQFKRIPNIDDYAFGVDFIIPIDNFQQNERSAKYGYLMISLTFLLFFLIQTLSKINIHIFQYLMIGLALVIFYTLLVSISEHTSFKLAYLIAGSAVVSLITMYSKSIMKIWKFPLFIGISLTALYSFIYIIIQLENYALLVGSIGIFVILALVMYASRKIEWN